MSTYESQTINARNPLARFAHRNRLGRSLQLALPKLKGGKLLDYGCGSGTFIAEIEAQHPGSAFGYEPFMDERDKPNLPISRHLNEVENHGPFKIITLFETLEHLDDVELSDFLAVCYKNLDQAEGGILISCPIEIGPAVFLKEANRVLVRKNKPEYRFVEFLMTVFFGRPARRAENIKISHRGFDFRKSVKFMSSAGWDVEILSYGPIGIPTWYGNSQVYMWVKRSAKQAD